MNATRFMRMVVVVAVLSGVLWCTERAQSEATQSFVPPKTQEPQDKLETGTRPAATQEKIHADVRSKLEESNDGRVYVLVTLKPLPKEGLTKEQRKAMAKERQDQLLGKLAEGEFTIDHRFATEPRMIGHVNAGALAKLVKQPDVRAIELSRIRAGVIPALNNSSDGKMLVMVSLHKAKKNGRSLRELDLTISEHDELTREHSSKVIDRLTHDDFELLNQLSIIPSFIGFIKASGVEVLAVDPTVRAVLLNETHHMEPTRPMPSPKERETQEVGQFSPDVPRRQIALLTSMDFLDVDEVYDLGYTGAGVTVAVLDSGANCNDPAHPINCASGGASFLNGESGTDVTDIDGHGTQVAYIIAGRAQAYPGVAPDAEVLRVKIMENNYFTTFDLVQGLEYVVAESQSRPNLRVMNLSLQTGYEYGSCNCDSADDWTIQLEDAFWKVKYLANIVSFALSGNSAYCVKVSAPACISHVEAVAAVYDGVYLGPFHWGGGLHGPGRDTPSSMLFFEQTAYGLPVARRARSISHFRLVVWALGHVILSPSCFRSGGPHDSSGRLSGTGPRRHCVLHACDRNENLRRLSIAMRRR